jgi:hypothetical protein
MTEQKKSSTSAPSNPPKGTVNVPQVETADADVDPNTVLGAQQNYAEGENPSDKGISGTYPAGDERLVRKADGQVWPADNRDAFHEQSERDARDADRASRQMAGADAPELIAPAANASTNSSVPGTSTDPDAAMTTSDLQAARNGGE